MVHIAHGPPDVERVLDELRPGDIVTHCATPASMALVRDGRVLDAALRAVRRGVVLDLGHGSGGFSFAAAEALLDAGAGPAVISSHQLSINGPMFDLPTCLTKLVALGVPLEAAIEAATTTPASLIGVADKLGTLAHRAPAARSLGAAERTAGRTAGRERPRGDAGSCILAERSSHASAAAAARSAALRRWPDGACFLVDEGHSQPAPAHLMLPREAKVSRPPFGHFGAAASRPAPLRERRQRSTWRREVLIFDDLGTLAAPSWRSAQFKTIDIQASSEGRRSRTTGASDREFDMDYLFHDGGLQPTGHRHRLRRTTSHRSMGRP